MKFGVTAFAEDVSRCLHVSVETGSLALPAGLLCSTLDSLEVDSALGALFTATAVDSISYVVPNAIACGELWYTPNSRGLVKPNFQNDFVFWFPSCAARDSAKVALESCTSILTITIPDTSGSAPEPRDSLWSTQWGMLNASFPGVDIGLLGAWDYTTGSSEVTVGIIKDAAYAAHPDFKPAVGAATVLSSDSYDNHGTFITGLIAAQANNGGTNPGDTIERGIAGINQKCFVRGYFPPGDGDAAENISVAADAGVGVLNMSFARSDPHSLIGRAIAYAYNNDVVLVASTGNNADSGDYFPAAFDGVIGVGGIKNDEVPAIHSNEGPMVDLVAPDGQSGISASRWLMSLTTPFEGYYKRDWGTSYACAQVAGVASLLRGAYPELSNDDIIVVLRASAREVDDPGYDTKTGYGLVKADSAFRILQLPNRLSSWIETPSVYAVTGPTSFVMNLGEGLDTYVGYKYELRCPVTFQKEYYNLIEFYMRGSASRGLKDSSYMYEKWSTEVVPGTLTATGAVLRTYVYELEHSSGLYIGWQPCRPEDARVSYGMFGEELLSTPTLYGNAQNGHHRMSWSDWIEFESNWHVDRKEGSGAWEVDYAVLPANSTSFTDSASGLIGSELYEYRIYPSTPSQTGSISNVVSLRAEPKSPSCVSGYVVRMNTMSPYPVAYCSACNTSECGGLVIEQELLLGGQLGEEEITQSIGGPPDCPSGCAKTNMLVVEWEEPENQLLGAIEGYRVFRFDDAVPPWYTDEDQTTALVDTMCSELSSENFKLGVITIDDYGDTSSRVVQVVLTTGPLDYCGGYGDPQEKLTVNAAIEGGAIPTTFALHQNHPNPFNAGTVIEYDLPVPSDVELEVFDVLGRRVAGLVYGYMPAGKHALVWDGRNSNGDPVASGIYFYRFAADDVVHTRKLVVVK